MDKIQDENTTKRKCLKKAGPSLSTLYDLSTFENHFSCLFHVQFVKIIESNRTLDLLS